MTSKQSIMHTNDDVFYPNDDSFSLTSSTASGDESNEEGSSLRGTRTKDEKWVAGSRCLFLVVLLSAAGALSGVVYLITHEDERENFENQYRNYGSEIIEASNENVLKAFEALETLSVTMTGFIKEQRDNGYPAGFIKVPDTEYHLTKAADNAGAAVVGYMPHVAKGEEGMWEEYALANQDWIAEANAAHGIDDPRFHDNTTLFYPRFYDYGFFNSEGDAVTIPFEVATCSKKESERVGLDQIQATISETRRLPIDPSTYQEAFYVPVWQLTPPPHPDFGLGLGNYNLMGDPIFSQIFEIISKTKRTTFFDICEGSKWFNPAAFQEDGIFSLIMSPVFDDHGENATLVGTLSAVVTWRVFFEDILVKGHEPVYTVMENKCGDKKFTYLIDGNEVIFMGDDFDPHDAKYDKIRLRSPFAEYAYSDEYLAGNNGDSCTYTINVYPTAEFEESFSTDRPWTFALLVLAVFFFTSIAFFVFDWLVQTRQKSLVTTAAKQNAIVASLFPKSIHKKLMAEAEAKEIQRRTGMGKAGLKKFLNDMTTAPEYATSYDNSKPIADLFPNTTIMFADIAGFTAWSSTREPSQVFTLLESIYHEFDIIAKRRRVFKVETIGDCYVAVCGLPDPRKDHPAIMARFASDCMRHMHRITEKLEPELGPDTADLGLRIGLHSGTVVAGVLRGDKSRFQLFGDTMNTASRMESTSHVNRIQLSQETASRLVEMGERFTNWVTEREDKVKVKGKGELKTYWLNHRGDQELWANSSRSDTPCPDSYPPNAFVECLDKQNARIARWTVEALSGLLKEVVASRHARGVRADSETYLQKLEQQQIGCPLEEVEEIIILPEYHATKFHTKSASETILREAIVDELRDYVQVLVNLYNENSFHNFSHANHVTMSVIKLLRRIVAPDIDEFSDKNLHDHTYGITSDPLTRFAVVFAALIHDLDHPGVPNGQLIKENSPMSAVYSGKSVAEQNSVDIAWDLLLEPKYKNLRRCIYTNQDEFKRFRQLVVNTVMATDIMDKDLKALRNKRWEEAFTSTCDDTNSRQAVNRKATIVIEHLIQASDVSHTMQHWHIYRRWNELFFMECYQAFLDGRAEADPSLTWYEGEKGFFDFYIIPLAKKLKECGVFGVTSDEYLNYAIQNRSEWEERGEGLVKLMIQNAHRQEVSTKVLDVSDQNE